MTHITDENLVADEGIGILKSAGRKLNFAFRQQSQHDVGIDGEIEFRKVGSTQSSGLLLKVQIKARSQLPDTGRFIIRVTKTHLQYWQSLTVPVIVVATCSATQRIFATQIDELSVDRSSETPEMSVYFEPSHQVNQDSIDRLRQLAAKPLVAVGNTLSNLLISTIYEAREKFQLADPSAFFDLKSQAHSIYNALGQIISLFPDIRTPVYYKADADMRILWDLMQEHAANVNGG